MLSFKGLTVHFKNDLTLSFPDELLESNQTALILGNSGVGKSTLLHILSGLQQPSSGEVFINNHPLYAMSESVRDRFRGRTIGFVFQKPRFIPSLDVQDNLRLGQYLAGLPQDDRTITDALAQLNLSRYLHARPTQLSGGQAQRVAFARAIINNPSVLLVDEPTANLDDETCEQVLDLVQALAQKRIVVLASHDARLKARFSQAKQIRLQQAGGHA